MFIVETIKKLDKFYGKLGLTIGNFEGFHLGHREIIRNLVAQSRRRGLYTAVITFKEHPLKILRQVEPERLTLPCDKIISLRNAGVDLLLYLDFSPGFADIEPLVFLEMLQERLSPRLYCLGSGFRFGRGNRGNIDFLRQNGEQFNYDLHIVDDILYESMPVSSTRIRDAVKRGDFSTVTALLGRYYYLFVTAGSAQPMLSPLCINCAFPEKGIYRAELIDVGSGDADEVVVKRVKNGFSLSEGDFLKQGILYKIIFIGKD